jgi:hypothetical protein
MKNHLVWDESGRRRRMFKGRWPQDPYGGSLLILPNLYVMLAFIVSP